jgi:hypothetical protein
MLFDYITAAVEDVSNDGVADVIVAFPEADTAAVDAGEIRVFEGGANLKGTAAPLATLQVSGASPSDFIGGWVWDAPVLIDDVTGDGVRDLVVVAPYADVAGNPDQGSIYVWAGGSALSGTPAPVATLQTSGTLLSYRLGDSGGFQNNVHLVPKQASSVGVAGRTSCASGDDESSSAATGPLPLRRVVVGFIVRAFARSDPHEPERPYPGA